MQSVARYRGEQGFYRSVQRVNNDGRVLCDLWRIKQMLREGRGGRCVFVTGETRGILLNTQLFSMPLPLDFVCESDEMVLLFRFLSL